MKHNIVPRSRGEVVPTPRTRIARVTRVTRVTRASVLPPRPAVRTVRAWLRELFSPPPPASFLSPSEHQLVNTRLHWLVPLRTIGQAAIAMPLAGLLLWILNSIAPGMVLLQVLLGLGAVFHQLWLGYVILRWRADHIIVTDGSSESRASSTSRSTPCTYPRSPTRPTGDPSSAASSTTAPWS